MHNFDLFDEKELSSFSYIFSYYILRGKICQRQKYKNLVLKSGLQTHKINERILDNLKRIYPLKNISGRDVNKIYNITVFELDELNNFFFFDKKIPLFLEELLIKNPLEVIKASWDSIGLYENFMNNGIYKIRLSNLDFINILKKCLESLNIEYNESYEQNKCVLSIFENKSTEKISEILFAQEITKTKFKHSEETKAHLSKKRKEYLEANPSKRVWKKFISHPCEVLKKFLKENNIEFEEEFEPRIKGRFFSIDIAITSKKIAIEVNGNQHYSDYGKTLKPYYQERHDLLVDEGWTVYEIPYHNCYLDERKRLILQLIESSSNTFELDCFSERPSGNSLKNQCSCGQLKYKEAKLCKKCFKESDRSHIQWPNLEDMEKLLWQLPITKIAEKLKVSDNAVRNHCKKRGLSLPSAKERRENSNLNNMIRTL